MAIILIQKSSQIGPVVKALEQFSRMQSEREQTFFFFSNLTHFLPHHSVVWQDKTTLKLIFVYNDCLYTRPKLDQSLLEILLHFVSTSGHYW